ncbi:hypothetical protein PF005_g25397 [Phytophthora fragariae]|uniref:Secreted protein n=1 Tax=Phytophthora fragariae TaxID=53985 RepID=A0A6A3DU34_9STRA|nr:hypothetical protein PF003_g12853 [Phytophthora fragariae]KAE8923636.1 hypothetical protein PF009_g26115 [Phytophthora fragariae]KAE8975997.1 hypothetical protein PF011_g24239 [Phytophthora fragariae]KAE9074372.1 hypothetical protein PF007_g25436 [Phytophthora fragariae]KAE9076642.1 hypothetical protein PF010_g23817 [Phytophthora fragariae]
MGKTTVLYSKLFMQIWASLSIVTSGSRCETCIHTDTTEGSRMDASICTGIVKRCRRRKGKPG